MPVKCSICCSLQTITIFTKKEQLFYRCVTCGFEFAKAPSNPNLSNSIEDFEPAYLDYFNLNKADRKNHSLLLDWIIKKTKTKPASLLDIGCGSGKWVNFLNESGCTATGIEPSAALFKNYLSGQEFFFEGDLSSFRDKHPRRLFDVITVFDVLEHIQDPVTFLQELSLLLHAGSYVFLSMPDNKSLFRKLAGKRWHYFNKYHFSYFNRQTLAIAAAKADLQLIAHSYKFRYFQPRYLWDYFKAFVLGKQSKHSPANGGIAIPLNLFDNMYCVMQKVH